MSSRRLAFAAQGGEKAAHRSTPVMHDSVGESPTDAEHDACPSGEHVLPHTTAIRRLLDEGRHAEARRRHSEQVDSELWRALRGESINLIDLLAARDELDLEGPSDETGG